MLTTTRLITCLRSVTAFALLWW